VNRLDLMACIAAKMVNIEVNLANSEAMYAEHLM